MLSHPNPMSAHIIKKPVLKNHHQKLVIRCLPGSVILTKHKASGQTPQSSGLAAKQSASAASCTTGNASSHLLCRAALKHYLKIPNFSDGY
jgi:hypothetical protein